MIWKLLEADVLQCMKNVVFMIFHNMSWTQSSSGRFCFAAGKELRKSVIWWDISLLTVILSGPRGILVMWTMILRTPFGVIGSLTIIMILYMIGWYRCELCRYGWEVPDDTIYLISNAVRSLPWQAYSLVLYPMKPLGWTSLITGFGMTPYRQGLPTWSKPCHVDEE